MLRGKSFSMYVKAWDGKFQRFMVKADKATDFEGTRTTFVQREDTSKPKYT